MKDTDTDTPRTFARTVYAHVVARETRGDVMPLTLRPIVRPF